jgi:hypothetical protein
MVSFWIKLYFSSLLFSAIAGKALMLPVAKKPEILGIYLYLPNAISKTQK